ncbi:hypothetical protein FOZ60_009942 [Perkinsus olseni]|uniref:Uncharacterized protein n=1 Tax=Perkinsus olseni TaxID=32597 RepID=A0A7J6PMT7_PEROL|nr:hypothetical protein FOZ60_009942 [Perkinsus olseni]
MKEFDTAEQLAIMLKPQLRFQREQDRRSGTTWLEEMEKKTEGHPEVIKYLCLKHHSEPRIWDRVTNKQIYPSHCYEPYAHCLRIIKGRYRQKYDTDEHLQKAESQFNNCTQGRGTVPEFIYRLEVLANELCHLGAAPLEYTLKWRLFIVLSDDKVRDINVAKSSYSYERFRNKVLSQAQRREQLGKVFYGDGRSHNNNSGSRRESSDFRRDSYKNVGYKDKYGRRNDNDRYRSGSRNRDRDYDRISSSLHSLSRESEMDDNGYQSRYLMAIGKNLVGIKW